ncbi:MAG: family 78 glycoside hydrolase catalytic domain, partial [Saprospiraceae bacterium]
KSAIISDLVYDGEIYDARQEQPDWCIASLDDTEWENAINRRTPYGKLVAHTAPTDKVMEILQPIKIQKLPNGNFKVDFAEEISGWVRLKNISAPSGHQIKITFNGNQYSGENTYIFNGKKSQNYAPRFNWFVFSSIEISNWFGTLKPENIQAEAVNTDIKKSSIFETSNPLFNKINKIWQRSQLDNMHGGIASDCPHRERSAYTGDAQVACQTVMANFEVKAFYKKWIRDILSSQIPETGYVPNGSPWQPGCGGGVAWGAAIQIIPWEFYQHYGDKEVLLESYEGMKGYMKYMKTWVDMDGIMYSQRTGKDGNPLKWWNLGEWAGVDHQLPPDALVHTFYYWLCADITANTAQILGNTDDYIFFKTIANDTRKAFIKKFYNAEKGTFGKNGANIFALKMGLEKAQYESVIKAVKTDIAGNDGHFDTGIFGTRYFFEVLADNGLQDLAYAAMNKTTVPSFGHWVSIGSTTTREQWDDSGSHNHPMFGGGLNWFYRNLAGMKTDEQTPGYKKIIFRPMPLSDLKQVNYFTETVFGKAGIEWKQNNGFEMHLEIPVGSTAIVYFPIKDQSKITENGKDIQSLNYVKNIKSFTDYRTFEIGSGVYDFKL